ncbi:MAG: zinc carboxypeptidase [Gracilimonas sp.]|uniref:M14 family metallopeptidase n=1 Tax=Gracilimonas sp. TaxID=1974203 RepID=UPI0019C805A1|nr:M14 family metallopeptidase [Gracilimonas sp.]MBD3617138.1 zinc carboxypeptidase [Gracilimonas sp.]
MKAFSTILFSLIFGVMAQAQVLQPEPVSLDYFLPDGVTYNSQIPTPEEVLGAQVGEWHVRHDQLVNYMYAVAEASDRVTITEYARTYENRPLLMLTITSPQNHQNIDAIKEEHLKLTDASVSDDLNLSEIPAVVTMSYSVHGNEPSGSNASLAVVYHLAAAQGAEIDAMLDNTIINVDPSINPDGLDRFAHWANTNKSKNVLVTDPQSREFDETWPGGRTNHYWFDLNRDWMPMIHPESQGRVAKFHEWVPQVLTDHHEMGTNSTFFFQPGIPSRTHPLTPQRNQALTGAIAEYHAEALDDIQSLYYSKESFDDFYYGKGSTYPDVNGSIGILFEQASSRGHAQESIHGIVEFPFTIKNQFVTSLSTLEAVQALKEELLANTREFYKEAAQEAGNAPIKAYVFGEEADQARTKHLAEMLDRNQIDVYKLDRDYQDFKAGKAFVVPTNQKQYKLLTAMFERRTEFTDSLFYDVSTWTMPYAFNLPFAELNRDYNSSMLGEEFSLDGFELIGELVGDEAQYAYAFEWDEYYAPRALYRLLANGVRAKVASQTFKAVVENAVKDFDYGTIMIPMGVQEDPDKVHEIIQTITEEDGITVYNLPTGLTPSGMDLGSGNFENLEAPKVAMIGGSGSNSSEVGEAWHLFDQRYHMPLSIIKSDDVDRTDLSRYNVIISSGYGISDGAAENLKEWVRGGGTLIVFKNAIRWAKSLGLANVEYVEEEEADEEEKEEVKTRPYVKAGEDRGAGFIGGSIFNAKLDLTHPMGYGFNDENITLFRNSTLFIEKGENPYSTPLYYTDDPLASGYSNDENLELIKGSGAVVVSGYGRGNVISMTDNPNFRAFWYGTNKLFANAIFFGHTISGGTTN